MASNFRNMGYAHGRKLRDEEIEHCKSTAPPEQLDIMQCIQEYHSVHCLQLQSQRLRLKSIDCKNTDDVAYTAENSKIVEIWSANYPGRASKTERVKLGPGKRNTLSKSSDLVKVKDLLHPASVTTVSFMAERILFTALTDGSVRMYDSIYELMDTWMEDMSNITDLHHNLHLDQFAVTSETSIKSPRNLCVFGANVFSFYRKGPIHQFFKHHMPTETLRFDPTGRMLATADVHGQIYIFDTRAGEPIRNFVSGSWLEKKRLEFSPDGKFITAKHLGVLNVFEVGAGRKYAELPASMLANDEFDFCYNISGNSVAMGGPDGLLRIWNVNLVRSKPTSEDFCAGGPIRRIRCTKASNFTCVI